MTGRLDGIETAFYDEFITRNYPYQSAFSIVSQVLGRQSLTEISVDYNRGLKNALQLATECKVHVQHTLLRHIYLTHQRPLSSFLNI